MTSEELAKLLGTEVFDVRSGAAYLGVRPDSLGAAVARGRIAHVKWAGMAFFTRRALDEYSTQSRRQDRPDSEWIEIYKVVRREVAEAGP